MEYVDYGAFIFLSALISAKWALDLKYSQGRQLIWAIGGLLFGPIAPLVLYINLVRKSEEKQ